MISFSIFLSLSLSRRIFPHLGICVRKLRGQGLLFRLNQSLFFPHQSHCEYSEKRVVLWLQKSLTCFEKHKERSELRLSLAFDQIKRKKKIKRKMSRCRENFRFFSLFLYTYINLEKKYIYIADDEFFLVTSFFHCQTE